MLDIYDEMMLDDHLRTIIVIILCSSLFESEPKCSAGLFLFSSEMGQL